MPVALFIGAHNEEIEAEIPLLPQLLVRAGWRVVILNPIGGWNWVTIRRMPPEMRERIRQDCLDAALALGCEKVLWDYDCGRTSGHLEEMTERIARFLRDTGPELIFIHWPRDGHQDHRAVAKASLHAIQSAENLISDDRWCPTWKEVWAFSVGIAQTYDFWPDVVVSGNQELMDRARQALDCFVAYGKNKTSYWWKNIVGKTSWWGALANGAPAEGYKFIGPSFPADGVHLKKVLGDQVISVGSATWTLGREYSEVSI